MDFKFENMTAFFDMGGYTFFVWMSFGLTFICMTAILFHSLYMSKKIKQGVEKERARAERILAARAARKDKMREKRRIESIENEDEK
jgi:heme exporter protein D